MSTDTVITATTDPDLLNKIASNATKSEQPPTVNDDYTLNPPDCHVTLPGGDRSMDGGVSRDAEVRELNGADEEAIAKTSSIGRGLLTILERGTVSVGGRKADRELLDELLSGDRDMLLLGIRKATYGNEVTYEVSCNKCASKHEVEIDLTKDIKVVTMDDPSQRSFTVQCRAGEVQVHLPTGRIQRELFTQPDKTLAEQTTYLLAGCVTSVNDRPSLGPATVKRLGVKDREKIMEEIATRNPGPRLTSVKVPCPNCEEELGILVTMGDLFRL